MQAKPKSPQMEWFIVSLKNIINLKHPLCILGSTVEWSEFDKTFGPFYSGGSPFREGKSRPAKPTWLMVGFRYLKHTFNLSGEKVVSRWLENPYWLHFCGNEYFEHRFPIDASLMTRLSQSTLCL